MRLKLEHPLNVWRARVWLVCAVVFGVIGLPLVWRSLRLLTAKSSGSLWSALNNEFEWWIECRWLTWILPGELDRLLPNQWVNITRWTNQWVYGLDESWRRISNTDSLSSAHAWWPLPLIVMCSISPAVFLLSPWTRARAKVRAGHVARWWVYGQGWVVLLFLWQLAILFLGLMQWMAFTILGRSAAGAPGTVGPLSVLAATITNGRNWYKWISYVPAPMESKLIVPAIWFLWLMWWNWCALRFGMRLKPAWMVFRVWALLMVVTVLVGIAVLWAQEVWLEIVVPRMVEL